MLENLPEIIALAKTLGGTRIHTFQGPFDDKITGVQFIFGKYGLADWEVHEKLMEFREKLKHLPGLTLKPTPGGRINVEFSEEAYTRRSW